MSVSSSYSGSFQATPTALASQNWSSLHLSGYVEATISPRIHSPFHLHHWLCPIPITGYVPFPLVAAWCTRSHHWPCPILCPVVGCTVVPFPGHAHWFIPVAADSHPSVARAQNPFLSLTGYTVIHDCPFCTAATESCKGHTPLLVAHAAKATHWEGNGGTHSSSQCTA